MKNLLKDFLKNNLKFINMEICIKNCRATASCILQDKIDHPIIRDFLSKDNLSALDIGCCFPEHLINLYHDFNFEILNGVELKDEKETVSSFIKAVKAKNKQYDVTVDNIYDLYKLAPVSEAIIEKRRAHLSRVDFYKKINIKFKVNANDCFREKTNIDFFDFLILSNILHLENNKQEIYELSIVQLKKGGLIFIRVNHIENQEAIKNKQFAFTEDEIYKLVSPDFTEIFSCKNLNENNKTINSLVYLGQKK